MIVDGGGVRGNAGVSCGHGQVRLGGLSLVLCQWRWVDRRDVVRVAKIGVDSGHAVQRSDGCDNVVAMVMTDCAIAVKSGLFEGGVIEDGQWWSRGAVLLLFVGIRGFDG